MDGTDFDALILAIGSGAVCNEDEGLWLEDREESFKESMLGTDIEGDSLVWNLTYDIECYPVCTGRKSATIVKITLRII